MLTTQEFSKITGVPYGTLRRWRSKFNGTDEGRQGVLVPVVVGTKGKSSLYAESQIETARRLHNPCYGQPQLFEEMTNMPNNENFNPIEFDVQTAAQKLFDAAIPADTANDAPIDAHAPTEGTDAQTPAEAENDAEPVTLKQFNAWCDLLDETRSGQLDCVNRLRRELQAAAGIFVDRQKLIELANAGKDFKECLNHFRLWLAQFNLEFVDNKSGELQRLVTYENGSASFENAIDAAHAELIIDDEFQALIPPLSDNEFRQLEENILADGIRDPLVVWKGHGVWKDNILLDGHHRFSIAQKHGLPFKTRAIEFADRDAVKLWIVQNQFGRRNVNRYSRGELALKLEPSIAAQAKANQGARTDLATADDADQHCVNIDTKLHGRTRDLLAKIAGVSTGTMTKIKFLVENASDEIKAALRADEVTISRAFAAVKAGGAVTVEDVLNFKSDRPPEAPPVTNDNTESTPLKAQRVDELPTNDDSESPSPTPTEPARGVDSSAAEVQATKVQDEPTPEIESSDVEIADGEISRICDGKFTGFVNVDSDDQTDEPPAKNETADAPNQDAPAQFSDLKSENVTEADTPDDAQDAAGDAARKEIADLLARVAELIREADEDALLVAKAGLVGVVASLEAQKGA